MSPSLFELSDLPEALRQHRIFGLLPQASRARLAESLQVRALAPQIEVCSAEDLQQRLHWLLAGEVALLDGQAQPVLVLQPGECFGLGLGAQADVQHAVTRTQAWLASLDAATLESLQLELPALAYFLPAVKRAPRGVEPAAGDAEAGRNLMSMLVRHLIRREPVTLAPQASIRQAAELMSKQGVSSVLLVEQGRLLGLITDRDLRNRVLAVGLDSERPVADIATLAPLTIDVHKPVFDALLLMARQHIHHLPVLDGERLVGMITASDLNEQHSTSAVCLSGEIYKHNSLAGLQQAAAKVQRLQQSLALAKVSAYSSGHIVTSITDAITSRLLQLGQDKLGPAPVDYVWVAAGSQARNEQSARTDQDNCMVLGDAYDPLLHGAYFKALSQFVCDGLNACGYVYCPGEMMAMNDAWRLPRWRWAELFEHWVHEPDPTALMLTCVFFDQRAVHGNAALLDELRRSVLQKTKASSVFLAFMVGNALQHVPPLGLFGGISTLRKGEHRGCVDLKHNGVVPIVDLARVFALAGALPAVNTSDRLQGVVGSHVISEQSARDLRHALEFLAFMRLQHQGRQCQRQQPPDNFLHLDEISNFERSQLKDAFTVVKEVQHLLGQRYQVGRL